MLKQNILIPQVSDYLQYKTNVLNEQIMATKAQNGTLLSVIQSDKSFTCDITERINRQNNKNSELRDRLVKLLGVIDGTIEPSEIKSGENSSERKPLHVESMNPGDQRLYTELLKAEKDLSQDNFNILKQKMRQHLSKINPPKEGNMYSNSSGMERKQETTAERMGKALKNLQTMKPSTAKFIFKRTNNM